MKKTKLNDVLVNNRDEHPERTGTTFARICEVLENVLPEENFSSIILKLKNRLKSISPHTPLSNKGSTVIIDELDKQNLSPRKMEEIVNQLAFCEFSTEEILDIHKKYKIPVSKLETDILPVYGDGCWIMDSKGKWYLDMDSNYSASNLGMTNSEIAKGLYNQAKTLICMKEDRLQVARTRFLKNIGEMMPKGLNYFIGKIPEAKL